MAYAKPSLIENNYYYLLSIDEVNDGFPLNSSNFLQQALSKDPLQYIMDLRIYPFKLDSVPHSASSDSIKVANITLDAQMQGFLSSGMMNASTTITVPAASSFTDYEPYSTAYLYLPFIGFTDVNLRQIAGSTVGVNYLIDVSSGDITAYITSSSVLIKTVGGHVGESIPLIGSDSRERLQRRASTTIGITSSILTGNAAGAFAGMVNGIEQEFGANGPNVKGNFSGGSTDFDSPMTPYILIIKRDTVAPTAEYKHTKGIPSGATASLRSLSGYTEIESIHLDGFQALDTEKTELEQILKSGVIF